MGLVFGILICIAAFPIGFSVAFMSSDFNTGRQTSSPWWAAVWFVGTLAVGGLVIYSHFHAISIPW
jgi:hypothetical protein